MPALTKTIFIRTFNPYTLADHKLLDKMPDQTLLISIILLSMSILQSKAFTPTDNYLIHCGSSEIITVGSRIFTGDENLPSKSLSAPKSIMASTTLSSVSTFNYPNLYRTARIFTTTSSYSFQISQKGRHFIRLHFYPFTFQTYDLTTAIFTVSTQDVTLFSNFQPTSTSSPILKEYLVNITHETLTLTFSPSSNLAFINAIEIISLPDDLIIDSASTINPKSSYSGLSSQVFETIYRVNMGTPMVSPENDTLWRTWVPDAPYILIPALTKWVSTTKKPNHMEGRATQETAPDIVYMTATELATSANSTSNAQFNMTWTFDLQEGFSYMIRLHFCDFVSKSSLHLYFNVFVGPWLVLQEFDLYLAAYSSLNVPIFQDFILSAKDSSKKMSVSVGPSSDPNVLPDGILNGLEIFKFDGISGTNTIVGPTKKSNLGVVIGSVVAGLVFFVIIIFIVGAFRKKRLERQRSSKTWNIFSFTGLSNSNGSNKTSPNTIKLGSTDGSLGFRFAFNVLQEATNNFDESRVIGVGGFGKVYKGVLRDDTTIAAKRGNAKSNQGFNEFRTEIDLLSRLRHRHLVSLVGYCDERNEMILVYEYMEKGTLKSHLYGSDCPTLSWKQRLEISIGSARGLHYLHTGFATSIIHRDVKSANILLDENLVAKVADFGLSKTGPELDQTHVSTAVKGSFGYLDPEYFRRQQLTDKSDVYSFGVVLLEVLCARPVIDPTLARDMINLADWALKFIRRGELYQIADEKIAGTIRPASLKKFAQTAEKCLADSGAERPSMGDVLWNLEYALQLQEENVDKSDVNSMNLITLDSNERKSGAVQESFSLVEGEDLMSLSDVPNVSMRRVFSQMIKNEGR